MGRMLGSTSVHQAMNDRMQLMMGAQGEQRLHQLMGERFTGCATGSADTVMGPGMTGGSSGNGNWGPMMSSRDYGWMMGGAWRNMSRQDWQRLQQQWLGTSATTSSHGLSGWAIAAIAAAGTLLIAAVATLVLTHRPLQAPNRRNLPLLSHTIGGSWRVAHRVAPSESSFSTVLKGGSLRSPPAPRLRAAASRPSSPRARSKGAPTRRRSARHASRAMRRRRRSSAGAGCKPARFARGTGLRPLTAAAGSASGQGRSGWAGPCRPGGRPQPPRRHKASAQGHCESRPGHARGTPPPHLALEGAPARNRTWNLRIKSPLLCQLSYKGLKRPIALAAGARSGARLRRCWAAPAAWPARAGP